VVCIFQDFYISNFIGISLPRIFCALNFMDHCCLFVSQSHSMKSLDCFYLADTDYSSSIAPSISF